MEYEYMSGLERQPLDAFFKPKAVAVVGASDKAGSVGRAILWNLVANPFGGTVYAVNPARRNALGLPCYPSVTALPERVDLAMIVSPAAGVPGVLDECIATEVPAAIIISAGFSEKGEAGQALEKELRLRSRDGRIRIIGPNSLGVMNPCQGLNAAYAQRIAHRGSVGFVSQSGALCAAILDWSLHENVGFSAFVSFGSMADVGWGEIIYYLGDDPNTKSIVIYMQSLGDARSFLSAAREVARVKPIIVLKAGRTEEGGRVARATPYYASPDIGSDEVLNAAFRRSGVLRVENIGGLFSMAAVLAKQPRPKGRRLSIVSNAAGPSILATDALVNGGGQLAAIAPETLAALDAVLPEYWNRANPVDALADATPERFARAAEITARDPNSDGLLLILTPQAMTDPTGVARAIAGIPQLCMKPVLASWMGGAAVAEGERILNECNIPTLSYPDTAAQVFNAMWRYSSSVHALYETPVMRPPSETVLRERAHARRIIETTLLHGKDVLNRSAAKDLLAAYGIPLIEAPVVRNAAEALHVARRTGYPVMLKLLTCEGGEERVPGGVLLNLDDPEALRRAFDALTSFPEKNGGPAKFRGVAVQAAPPKDGCELCLGSGVDPQFGPYLYFGAGGGAGGMFHDRVFALPPLNSTLARRAMEETLVYQSLANGGAACGIDLDELEQVFVRFSMLVIEQPWIKEIAIDPLLAAPGRFVALEASVRLHAPGTPMEALPRLAIRPYPVEYVMPHTLPKGMQVTFRPIRPEDETLMAEFHKTLSDESVYYRYFRVQPLEQRIQHDRLSQLCFVDYDRGMGLVAQRNGSGAILGVARYVKLHGTADADFALIVSDLCQGQGLGAELMRKLIHVARNEHIRRLVGAILPDNRPMLRLCKSLGFELKKPLGEEVIAELTIA